MTYESFEVVELGEAEVAIETILPDDPEEQVGKFSAGITPYVEYDE